MKAGAFTPAILSAVALAAFLFGKRSMKAGAFTPAIPVLPHPHSVDRRAQ